MQRHIISILICITYLSIGISGQLFSLIQFPSENFENTVGFQYNSTYKSHFKSEYEYYKSDGYVLDLTNQNLQSVPNKYTKTNENQKISVINLQGNKISRVSADSLISVPNVEYLDLSRNRLLFCNFFNYGTNTWNLRTLIIEENEPPRDSISREISKADCFQHVQYLYLRKNRIQKLNFSLRQSFPSLVSLYLSNNEFYESSFIQDVPPSLAYLYVENNRLSSIDCTIIRNLKTLSADDNTIRSICYRNCESSSLQLLGTTKLEILSLARNRIERIEACAFSDSWSLVCLNLAGNQLDDIQPTVFVPLRLLAQLNLDNNRLTRVPNLKGNWHLKALSLRNNRITEINRQDFSSLTILQKLLLGGNCIRSVSSDTFNELTTLQMLDLSNNGIESLPIGWMNGLVNLKYLDLRNNRFAHVYQLSLRVSLCLKELHLEDNKYTRSDESSIQMYVPNARVYLDSCSYNTSSKIIVDDYSYRTYWEMSTSEKSDFSYKLNYVVN